MSSTLRGGYVDDDGTYHEMSCLDDYRDFVSAIADDVADVLESEYEQAERCSFAHDVTWEHLDAAHFFIYNRHAPMWGDIILYGNHDTEFEHLVGDTPLDTLRSMAFAVLRDDVVPEVEERVCE